MNWRDGGVFRFPVQGGELEGKTLGPPPTVAPTLVLLHEGLGCVSLWRDFPERLAAATGWGVFLWSRAGYGLSDPAPRRPSLEFLTKEAREVLPEVLDAAGVETAVLLGHSDGATIAAIHAGSVHDPRVRGLVLMAPHFFREPAGLDAIRQARRAFETGDLKDRLAKYHRDVEATFNGWCDPWLDPASDGWNVEEVITGFRAPTMVIQGDADRYGTLAQVETVAENAPVPVQVEILPGCGHSPHLENGDTVVALVAGFCVSLGEAQSSG